jgi:hypothetical protein
MDRPLVERARQGDREAFDAIVRGKVDAVYATALAILGHEADAQDAAQEAFIAAWRSFGTLRDPDRFEAWFGRIRQCPSDVPPPSPRATDRGRRAGRRADGVGRSRAGSAGRSPATSPPRPIRSTGHSPDAGRRPSPSSSAIGTAWR